MIKEEEKMVADLRWVHDAKTDWQICRRSKYKFDFGFGFDFEEFRCWMNNSHRREIDCWISLRIKLQITGLTEYWR
jgi:hypothetical protein